MSRFNIDFKTDVQTHKLKKELFDLDSFRCSNKVYEDYLKKEAYNEQENSLSQTWVFVYKKQNVIGYVSIAMGDINKTASKKLMKFPHTNIPGVLLGQLATHIDYEGLGVGRFMVGWVYVEASRFAESIGCRLLYLNPDKGLNEWYTKMGFTLIQKKNKQDIMFRDLKS